MSTPLVPTFSIPKRFQGETTGTRTTGSERVRELRRGPDRDLYSFTGFVSSLDSGGSPEERRLGQDLDSLFFAASPAGVLHFSTLSEVPPVVIYCLFPAPGWKDRSTVPTRAMTLSCPTCTGA